MGGLPHEPIDGPVVELAVAERDADEVLGEREGGGTRFPRTLPLGPP